jgi:CBS domain-containing protein
MNLEAQTHELKVGEYMTPNPITVQSDITLTDAATHILSIRLNFAFQFRYL